MATVADLRREAARWFGKGEPTIEAYIRRLRERGLIPVGVPGKGKSKPIEAEHALALLLAILSGEEAPRAAEAARERAAYSYVHSRFEFYREDTREYIGSVFRRIPPLAVWTPEHGELSHSAGTALASVILELRADAAVSRVLEIRAGVDAGVSMLGLSILPPRLTKEDVNEIARAVMPSDPEPVLALVATHVSEGTPVVMVAEHQFADLVGVIEVVGDADFDARASAPLSWVQKIGGNVVHEIAALLGPLPAASGGGGPRVSTIGPPHETPEPHKLAALSALAEMRPEGRA